MGRQLLNLDSTWTYHVANNQATESLDIEELLQPLPLLHDGQVRTYKSVTRKTSKVRHAAARPYLAKNLDQAPYAVFVDVAWDSTLNLAPPPSCFHREEPLIMPLITRSSVRHRQPRPSNSTLYPKHTTHSVDVTNNFLYRTPTHILPSTRTSWKISKGLRRHPNSRLCPTKLRQTISPFGTAIELTRG